jgi:hypothetical protein
VILRKEKNHGRMMPTSDMDFQLIAPVPSGTAFSLKVEEGAIEQVIAPPPHCPSSSSCLPGLTALRLPKGPSVLSLSVPCRIPGVLRTLTPPQLAVVGRLHRPRTSHLAPRGSDGRKSTGEQEATYSTGLFCKPHYPTHLCIKAGHHHLLICRRLPVLSARMEEEVSWATSPPPELPP